MGRKSLFDTRRPVLGGAHGGTVHHEPFAEFVSSHIVWEVVLAVLLVVLVALIALTIRASLITQEVVSVPSDLPAEFRSYDAIEKVRATRLVSSDRTYDSVEGLRTSRLAAPSLVGDRSYEAVESVRAGRLAASLRAGDRSYDPIETVRLQRSLGR